MRLAMCCDEVFLATAGDMIERLAVGLLDEGARLLRLAPPGAPELALPGAESVTIPEPALLHPLGARLRRLDAELRERAGGAIDIVHAFGAGSLNIASGIAERHGAILVVELWGEDQIRPILARARTHAGEMVIHIAAPALAEPLRDAGWRGAMRTTAWGVHAISRPPPVREQVGPVCVVLAGSGADAASWESCADALLEARSRNDLLIFCDAQVARRSGLLKIVRQGEAMDSLSLLPPIGASRELLVRADLVLHPDPYSVCSMLVLEAMSRATPVVLRRGVLATPIEQGSAAWLAGGGRDQTWQEALGPLLDSPSQRAALGEMGWSWVRAERRGSAQVAAVINAYDTLLRPATMAFPGTEGA